MCSTSTYTHTCTCTCIHTLIIPQIPCPFYCPQYKGMPPEASHSETPNPPY